MFVTVSEWIASANIQLACHFQIPRRRGDCSMDFRGEIQWIAKFAWNSLGGIDTEKRARTGKGPRLFVWAIEPGDAGLR
jgi:hypothetical protein